MENDTIILFPCPKGIGEVPRRGVGVKDHPAKQPPLRRRAPSLGYTCVASVGGSWRMLLKAIGALQICNAPILYLGEGSNYLRIPNSFCLMMAR